MKNFYFRNALSILSTIFLLSSCLPTTFTGAASSTLWFAKDRFAGNTVTDIRYPVLEYPFKVKSLKLEKTNSIEGVLKGIKGQYLILDTGVINVRKYTAHNVDIFL